MNFDNYAGLVSAVGIVLILILVVWLDLWGPINLSALERWQTLMTGFMAIVAASIAYLGATANVRHNRQIAAREDHRRRLSLYLKMELALREIHERARYVDAGIEFGPAEGDQRYAATDIEINEPSELKEAWDYLDLFPSEMIAEIRNIRNCLREMATLVAGLGSDSVTWNSEDKAPPRVIGDAQSLTNGIRSSSFIALDILEPFIRQMAPDLPQNERLFRTHGDGD